MTDRCDTSDAPRSEPVACMQLGMIVRADEAVLDVAGELDLVTAPRLAGALRLLDGATSAVVDLAEVTFADTAGLEPLVEAVRRTQRGSVPLIRTRCSAPTRRVFNALGVACEPAIDVAAWDCAAKGVIAPRSTTHVSGRVNSLPSRRRSREA